MENVIDSQKIMFEGEIVAKKNSKKIVYYRGSPSITSSDQYKAWRNHQIALLTPRVRPMKPPYLLTAKVWRGSLKTSDLDNKLGSLCDVLAKMGVITDDNDFVLQSDHPQLMGIDRNNPRTEVTVYSLEPNDFDHAYSMMLSTKESKALLKATAKANNITMKALREHCWAALASTDRFS